MNLNSPSPWPPAASVCTKMPSLPSSFLPTATRSPARTRRISRTQSTPIAIDDERGVHARLAREPPLAADPDVGRKVRGREEVFGQHAVGGRRDEARVGCRRERGALKSG